MIPFPESADQFYALRDDRTNSCSGVIRAYQETFCALCLSPSMADTASGQAMFLVAANLLSRWCRDVQLVLPPTPVRPSLGFGAGDLGDVAISQMHDADPFGSFRITQGPVTAQAAVCIGDGNLESVPMKVYINASGWLASLSYEGPTALTKATDENYLGAVAAACLGVAQLFKAAIAAPPERSFREGTFDLFRLEWVADSNAVQAPWPEDRNIGNVLMVGAGSVGSAAAYCMRLAQLAGQMTILDHDYAKVENFNRSPLFGRDTFMLSKSEVAAKFLRHSRISAHPLQMSWDDFVRTRTRDSLDFDVWLPLANEQNVRSAMQNNIPPLMIHASTSSDWGVNHGRHIPGKDDCLVDRFRTQVTADDLTCATGKVTIGEISIDAALPFSSMFAGVLIAADLVRAQLPGYPQIPNFAFLDWFGAFDTIQAWDRKTQAGCICTQQGRAFHERFNGHTKYFPLFQRGTQQR